MLKENKLLAINFKRLKSELNRILFTAGEIAIGFIAIMSAVFIWTLICLHFAAISKTLALILFFLGLGTILFVANKIDDRLIDLAETKKDKGKYNEKLF